MPCGLVLCTSGVVEILGILLVVPDIRVVDVFFSRFFSLSVLFLVPPLC